MADEDKSILTFVIGKETISGTKSASGAYKNPNANIEIYNKNPAIDVPKGTSKLVLKVPFEYEEATTKKDIPNFQLILKKDGAEFKKAFWSDPDIFYKFEEHKGELTIELNLQEFFSDEEKIKLNFSAHLDCWLEEQPWRGGQTKTTVSAAGSADLEFNLPKVRFPGVAPEISLDIFPTHSPGTDLKNYVNVDWGNPYSLRLHLENKSNNNLTPGAFTLFENDKNIKDANLKKDLEPKWKITIISEDSATWILTKGPDDKKKNDFKWYEDDILGKYKSKETSRKYDYFVTGKTTDEFGFTWDLKIDKIKVNVRVPDYKVKAMDTYNWVMGADWLGSGLIVALNAALSFLAARSSKLGTKAKAGAGSGITIEGFLFGRELKELVSDVKKELKLVMDDPPLMDNKYAQAYKPRIIKFKVRAEIAALTKKYLKFLTEVKNLTEYSRAMRIANDRYWTAKLKVDKNAAKTQRTRFLCYRNQFRQRLCYASESLHNLSNKFTKVAKNMLPLSDSNKKLDNMGFKKLSRLCKKAKISKSKIKKIAQQFSSLASSFSKLARSLI